MPGRPWLRPVTTDRIASVRRGPLTFDVVDSGPVDGTPVVLLHGFPQRATMWAGVVGLLHEAGLRTFAPDQRGYSPGARPRSRFAYRPRSLARDVVALIDAIGQPVHLVGHDWGAAVAWATAGHFPQRLRSLTTISVGHPAAYIGSLLSSDQLLRSCYIAVFQLPWLAERSLREPGGWGERLVRSWGMTDEMYEQYQREVVAAGAVRGSLGWYRSLPVSPFSDLRLLASTRVPTTFIWGENDRPVGPAQALRTARHVAADFDFVSLRGTGHWVVEECPSEVARAITRRVRSVADAG